MVSCMWILLTGAHRAVWVQSTSPQSLMRQHILSGFSLTRRKTKQLSFYRRRYHCFRKQVIRYLHDTVLEKSPTRRSHYFRSAHVIYSVLLSALSATLNNDPSSQTFFDISHAIPTKPAGNLFGHCSAQFQSSQDSVAQWQHAAKQTCRF
jgi:hypothetical protein